MNGHAQRQRLCLLSAIRRHSLGGPLRFAGQFSSLLPTLDVCLRSRRAWAESASSYNIEKLPIVRPRSRLVPAAALISEVPFVTGTN